MHSPQIKEQTNWKQDHVAKMYAFIEEMGNSEALCYQFTSMQQDRSTVSRNGSFGVSIRQAEHKPPEISMKEHTNMHTVS